MSEADQPSPDRSAGIAWLSQDEILHEEQKTMQISLTPDQICRIARSREKLNRRVGSAIAAAGIALVAGLLYNVWKIDQPWIRLGQAWTLAVLSWLIGSAVEGRRDLMSASESCSRFLIASHENRRRGYLVVRRRLLLFIPGIAACWWGRPPRTPDWLFPATLAVLAAVWFLFGKAAEKAARDCEEILRRMGNPQ